MAAWRERIRPTSRPGGVRPRDRQRASRGRRVAAHTHAQIYALDFVLAAVACSASASVRTPCDDGRQPACRLVQEEAKLRERIVAIDDEGC
jgi:galactose-1-phosphate uridylyltransferase